MQVKKICWLSISILLFMVLVRPVFAANEQRGRASIAIKGGFFSKITDEERLATRRAAIFDAWKNYLNNPVSNSISRVNIFDANKAEVDAKLSKCVTSPSDCEFMSQIFFESEKIDDEKKTFTVIVLVSINDQRVTAFVNSKSPPAKAASITNSGFAFLFLQRNATSNKQTLEKREDQAEAAGSLELESTPNSVSASAKKSASVERSQTQVRDKTKYAADAGGGADVSARVNSALGQVGLDTSEVKDILDGCEKSSVYDEAVASFQQQGTVGNFADMAKNVRVCGVQLDQPFKFFGIAEAEASAPVPDYEGQMIVFNVRVRVTNIEKNIPKTVGSAGPIQIKGVGKASADATRNGLQKVGDAASRIIIDILSQKNLN